ncbi:hypothetical protein ACTFIW_005509 [Dictyostelium discoideum]
MSNPIPISEDPESYCITKEVQDLLLDGAIEQVLPNRYSKRVFYSNVFTVPKPGATLHRPVITYTVPLSSSLTLINPMIQAQVLGTFQEVLTKQSVESIPIQIQ